MCADPPCTCASPHQGALIKLQDAVVLHISTHHHTDARRDRQDRAAYDTYMKGCVGSFAYVQHGPAFPSCPRGVLTKLVTWSKSPRQMHDGLPRLTWQGEARDLLAKCERPLCYTSKASHTQTPALPRPTRVASSSHKGAFSPEWFLQQDGQTPGQASDEQAPHFQDHRQYTNH